MSLYRNIPDICFTKLFVLFLILSFVSCKKEISEYVAVQYDELPEEIDLTGLPPTLNENDNLKLMTQKIPLFNHCHDVCVDEDKNLYVGQWNANKTYPIKLERV